MDRNEIISRIKKILAGEQFLSVHNLLESMDENTSFINDFALDSIQILEMIVCLEDEFHFVCEPYELNIDIFDNFGELISFVAKKTA